MIAALRSYDSLVTWGDIAALAATFLLGAVMVLGCVAMGA